MLIIEKILRFIFVWYMGKLIVDQYWNTFLNFWKKLQMNILRNSLMLHIKVFLFNFNDFTITKMVEVPWDGVQRECGLKLFGLAFLREEILSWRRHYPEVLKLMVNNHISAYSTRQLNTNPTFLLTMYKYSALYNRYIIYLFYIYNISALYIYYICFI